MNPIQNPWADIKPANIKSPKAIMEELANVINSSLKAGQIKVTVELYEEPDDPFALGISLKNAKPGDPSVAYRMYVKALPLKYTLLLMEVSYQISALYPCTLENVGRNSTEICINQEELQEKVIAILSSPKIKEIIAILLAQL